MTGSSTPATILAAGAVISIFSVTLVTIYGQTRILFAMGRDGMVPPLFHRLNPTHADAGPGHDHLRRRDLAPRGPAADHFLAEMTSIGTLVAFLIVSIGVILLRRREPDLPRGFKVPGYPVTPILSIAGCIWIIHGPARRDDLRLLRLGGRGTGLVLLLRSQPRHARPGRGGERGHAMTMVVGIAPDGRGRAALHLAGMLARSGGDDVLLCAVVPLPWPPSPARVDAEYRAYLDTIANEALEQARTRLPEDVTARSLVHHARSAPAGLVEAAEQHDASLIVVGSSSAGVFGHVSLGSVSDRLLHSSPVSVALSPRGHRCKPDSRVERVTAAFGGTEGADDLVVGAAGVAAHVGASLRIASFAVRSRPPYTSGVGSGPEQAIIKQWVQEIEAASRAILERIGDLPAVPRELRDRRRLRRELGRGARGHRVARRRRARRRVQRGRAVRAGLPRLPGVQDRPPLTRPGRRRPPPRRRRARRAARTRQPA